MMTPQRLRCSEGPETLVWACAGSAEKRFWTLSETWGRIEGPLAAVAAIDPSRLSPCRRVSRSCSPTDGISRLILIKVIQHTRDLLRSGHRLEHPPHFIHPRDNPTTYLKN